MLIKKLALLIFFVAPTLLSAGVDVPRPHERPPTDLPQRPAAPAADRGLTTGPIFRSFSLEAGASGVSAEIQMLAQDVDGDGIIHAASAYYGGGSQSPEIIYLTITFLQDFIPFQTYENIVDSTITYDFLYLDWVIGAPTFNAWDLGADPGWFAFGGLPVTIAPGSWFQGPTIDANGTFAGGPLVPQLLEPITLTGAYRSSEAVGWGVAGDLESACGDLRCFGMDLRTESTSEIGPWSVSLQTNAPQTSGEPDCDMTWETLDASVQQDSTITPTGITFSGSLSYELISDMEFYDDFYCGYVVNASASHDLLVTFLVQRHTTARMNIIQNPDAIPARELVARLEASGEVLLDTEGGPESGVIDVPLEPGPHTFHVSSPLADTFNSSGFGQLEFDFEMIPGQIVNVTKGTDHPTIWQAVDAASDGDTIELAVGTYREVINLQNKAITLTSTDPSDPAVVASTIISGDVNTDGVPDLPCLIVSSGEGPSTVIRGLTFEDGIAEQGGGLQIIGSSPTIEDCIIRNCFAAAGGGGVAIMPAEGAAPVDLVLNRCIFESNVASDQGGGLLLEPGINATINECTFTGNAAASGGGIYLGPGSTLTMADSLLSGNAASVFGAAIETGEDAEVDLTDTDVTGNAGYSVLSLKGASTFTRCEITGNSSTTLVDLDAPLADFRQCLFAQNLEDRTIVDTSTGVDSREIQLTNCTLAASGDVAIFGGARSRQIVTNSIIVGARALAIVGVDNTVSHSIIEGGHPGVGVLDVDPGFVDPLFGDFRLGVGSRAIDAGANPALGPADTLDLLGMPRRFDDFFTEDTGVGPAPIVDMGAYEYSGGNSIDVPGDFAAIQDAIDAASPGETIVIAPGTYREHINLMGKAIKLQSTDPSDMAIVDQTILSGDLDNDGTGDGTVVRCNSGEGPMTVLDGLSIVDGFSTGFAAGLANDNGASPLVLRCRFEGHVGDFGAATSNRGGSTATYIGCRFLNNRTTQSNGGPAAWNGDSSPRFINCLVAGSVSDFPPPGGSGGAFTNINAGLFLANCTIVGSRGGNSVIFNFGESPLTMVNSIVWDSDRPAIVSFVITPDVTYSIVEFGYPGIGNLSSDPGFVDERGGDYRLDVGSPAIDAGDNIGVPAGIEADIAGSSRFIDDPATPDTGNGAGPIVDIGAYEYEGTQAAIAGDANGDDLVNFVDLNMLLDAWGDAVAPPGASCDFDADGVVNFGDLNILLDAWGASDAE